MRCRACTKKIDPYLDRALGQDERAAFEAHVAICPACAAELARSRELHALVEESRVEDWADTDRSWTEFRGKVAQADAAPAPRRRLAGILIPVAAAGAAAGVALTLAILAGDPATPEQTANPAVAEADPAVPAQDLVEILMDLDLYESLDCFEGVELVAQAGIGREAALLEELLEEVEG